MRKVMLRIGKIFYNHVEIVCVTCLNIFKMGFRMGAMTSFDRTLHGLTAHEVVPSSDKVNICVIWDMNGYMCICMLSQIQHGNVNLSSLEISPTEIPNFSMCWQFYKCSFNANLHIPQYLVISKFLLKVHVSLNKYLEIWDIPSHISQALKWNAVQ